MTGITATAQNNGVRVDEIDLSGERTISYYPQNIIIPFYVDRYNDNWYVKTSYDSAITAKLRFVPYGTESYSLTVETFDDGTPASEKVKVTVEIVDEKTGKPQRIAYEAGSGMTVKCGTKIRLQIDVPTGYLPAVSMLGNYTGINTTNEGAEHWVTNHALTITSMNNSGVAFSERRMDDPRYRQQIADYIKNGENSGFERDQSVPSRWIYEYVMDNEPMTIRVFAEAADAQMLQGIASSTMRSLYTQYQDLPTLSQSSGEPYFMMVTGDRMSDDYISTNGWDSILSPESIRNPNSVTTYCPWVRAKYMISPGKPCHGHTRHIQMGCTIQQA